MRITDAKEQLVKTTYRHYAEELGDFNRVARFLVEHNDHVRAYSTWCIGRFVDWKYGLYESKTAVPDFCRQNAQLWFDGFQELAGVAIAENGDADFAIITLAGYRFLFEGILQWVLDHWGERGPHLSIEVTELETAEARVLERFGFERAATFYTQQFDLAQEPVARFALEDGFTIVDMFTHPDYLAQRILRDDAFSGRRFVSEEDLRRELLFYNHLQEGPIYHPQTDLCVMAQDGRLVAGCEALIDARNAEADIERVCTHSSFRRRGFARAVIQECLRRLHEMGIRKAYITGYSTEAIALYASLGAGNERSSFIYQRK
jgi:GNAT superfamily N-acetyltransferase